MGINKEVGVFDVTRQLVPWSIDRCVFIFRGDRKLLLVLISVAVITINNENMKRGTLTGKVTVGTVVNLMGAFIAHLILFSRCFV